MHQCRSPLRFTVSRLETRFVRRGLHRHCQCGGQNGNQSFPLPMPAPLLSYRTHYPYCTPIQLYAGLPLPTEDCCTLRNLALPCPTHTYPLLQSYSSQIYSTPRYPFLAHPPNPTQQYLVRPPPYSNLVYPTLTYPTLSSCTVDSPIFPQ